MSPSNIRKVKPSTIKARSRNKKLIIVGVLAALFILIGTYVVYTQGGFNMNGTGPTPSPVPTATPYIPEGTKVRLETSMGNITIQLRDDMPITTANFKKLAYQGVYDGTIFHRVISNFMIQGGDPMGTGAGDPSIPSIPDEFSSNSFNNRNDRGTIAMANAGANTGSSQFFINVVYNDHLDNQHPVFGEVIEGMDVVDAISNVATTGDQGNPANKPLQDVMIIRAEILP